MVLYSCCCYSKRSESLDSYTRSDSSYTTAWSNIQNDREGEEDKEEFSNDIYTEMDNLLIDIENDKVAKAGRRLKHIKSICSIINMPSDILNKWNNNYETIKLMEKRAYYMENVRDTLNNDNGWTLQRDNEGIKTYYKYNKDRHNIHSLRIEGIIKAPLFDLMALLSEVDFYSNWMPSYKYLGIIESKKIAEPKATQMLFHIVAALPWPFNNRDLVISIDGIDCIGPYEDPRQIVVLLKSESGSSYESYISSIDMPIKGNRSTTCDIIENSGATLTPLGNGQTFMQAVFHIDPHISLVPEWLIDIVARNFCYLLLQQVRSAVDIVKEPCYQERMRDPNNAFYQYTRKRIEEDMPEEMKYVPSLNSIV